MVPSIYYRARVSAAQTEKGNIKASKQFESCFWGFLNYKFWLHPEILPISIGAFAYSFSNLRYSSK